MINGEALLAKMLMYMPKILFATIGAVVSLIFSGDIKPDGSLKIGWGIIIKMSVSIAIGLAIGESFIFYYDLQHIPMAAVGIVFLLSSIFGLLALGLLYRSIELTFTNKKLSDIIKEVKQAFAAVFGK
ncbi:hypothetical protein ACTXGK_10605 [Psychrobacter sp. T6-5]|uniref:hypothetical protein n=1 Tax=Psychrobacter sp. T6-5 TaxID=3457451 RepID=UPI003FCFF58E